MHTHFVALHKKSANTHIRQNKIKNPQTPQKLHLLLDQWVREILAFERLANMLQEKKVWDHPGDFFAFLIKMQIFANVCGSTQPLSGPIVVPGGSINKAKTLYPLPST